MVKDAKIALLDFGLQRHKMQLGVQVCMCVRGLCGYVVVSDGRASALNREAD